MKRLFSLAVLLVLGVSLVFAGGGRQSKSSSSQFTISYWVGMHTNASKVLTDWNDNECFQELERRTGVHVNFIHPPIGQETEQYNLMIASRDLPDIVSRSYPGGDDKGFVENVYRPLDNLMQYNPNLASYLNNNPEIKKQMTTNNGHIWGWPNLTLPENQGSFNQMPDPWAGPGVRGDWLVDLGLEQPRTIDDWYRMLILFRDKKGAQVPLIMSKNGQPGNSEFVGAFGIGSGYYHVNNVVKYGPIENGYKDYLALMQKWYSEGLLDPDFAATNSDTNFYSEYITTGKAGAIVETYQDIVPLYNSLFSNKANYMTAVPYPVLRAGDTGHFGVINNFVDRTGNDFLTTRVSEDRVERICNWRDSWYTPESTMLFNYGIEGRSYNMVNGKPVFTNLLANNPDGLDYAVASWKYKLFCHSYIYNCFAKPESEVEASWASISTWKIQNDMANQMPPSMIRAEDSSDYSNIMTEVNTYKNQMVLKFIMGEEPLSNFDAYVRQLKAIGIEKAIQYQQTALDLYNSH